jgi:hypothetical protein
MLTQPVNSGTETKRAPEGGLSVVKEGELLSRVWFD